MVSDAERLKAARKWLKGHSYCGLHGLFRGDAMFDNCPSCDLARITAERDGLREEVRQLKEQLRVFQTQPMKGGNPQ